MLRHGANDWLAGTISFNGVSAQAEAECVVSQSTELSRGEQQKLEATLENAFSRRKMTYRRYDLDGPKSHVVALFEVLSARLQPCQEKLQEIRANFVQCATDGHDALVSFAETVLGTTHKKARA